MAETKKTTSTKTTAAKKTTSTAAKKTTAAPKAAAKTTTTKKAAAPKAVKAVEVKVEEVVAPVVAEAPKAPVKKEIAGPKLQIKLVKSKYNRLDAQKKTLEALGLRKINQVVTKPDNACTRGQIYVVKHLVEVTEIK